jgi:uncharacterized protein (TIGR02996 family)
MGEDGFLQAILHDPRDDTLLLVYADWLEEQGDTIAAAKAEFLRVNVEYASRPKKKGRRSGMRKRLQQLAATLDTAWLAVVSRVPIESCQGKRAKAESRRSYVVTFEHRCDRRWEDLRPTDNGAVRFCDTCQHNVHYCDTIIEARKQAWARHCIAVDLGVIRRAEDLEPARHWLGRPSPETVRHERERMLPDPVSAERERQKKNMRGEGTKG